MRCPHCETENRDDRASCYHCGKDLTILRLIVNRAKQHYNNAVEHAEMGRWTEALGELDAALELNARMEEALVLRGSLLVRLGREREAEQAWRGALALNPNASRAQKYLDQLGGVGAAVPLVRRARRVLVGGAAVAAVAVAGLGLAVAMSGGDGVIREALAAVESGELGRARTLALEARGAEDRERLLGVVARAAEAEVGAAEALLAAGRPMEAGRRLAVLEAAGLSGVVASRAEAVRARARAAAIRGVIDIYTSGEDPAGAEREFLGVFPAGGEALAAARAEKRREVEGRVAGWLDEAARASDALEAARVLARAAEACEVAARLGDGGEACNRVKAEAEVVAASLMAEAEAAAERGDADGVSHVMAAARVLPVSADMAGRLAGLERVYTEVRLAEVRERLLEAHRRGDWEEGLALAEAAEELVAREDWPADLGRLVEGTRRRAAVEAYARLMEEAAEIEAGPLEEERAARVLALTEVDAGALPPGERARAEENLLYFRARALEALGRRAEAEDVSTRLGEAFPRSPYLRSAAD